MVTATPGDRGLGGINVRHVPAGLGGDQRSRPGVAEKVEQAGSIRASGLLLGQPLPVGRLFGEDAKLLGIIHEAQLQLKFPQLRFPVAGAIAVELPAAFAPAFFVHRDGFSPFGPRQALAPPGFGFAADHADATDFLELEAVAGVQKAVAFPIAD